MLLQALSILAISLLMKKLILSPVVQKAINLITSAELEHREYKHDSIKKSVAPAPVLKTVRYNPVRKLHTFATMIKLSGSIEDVRMNKPESSRTDTGGGQVSKAQTLISNLM